MMRAQISLNSMVKVARWGMLVCLLELTTLFKGDMWKQRRFVHQEINRLLKRYSEVFQMPKKLPPVRTQEHTINLQPGSAPINLRLYMYSFTQKNEIEALLKEMLEAKVIRPSISPFSSPVLLVNKRDGG